MSGIDALFIHIGRHSENRVDILLMPMGIIALSNLLNRNAINAKIFNFSIEKIENNDLKIEDIINKFNPKILLFTLHWYQQSKDVINTINKIKKKFPYIKIAIGGFTASAFYKEIMQYCDNIDFIIRGDAEIPLLNLCKTILNGQRDYKDIPNLAWRNGKRLIYNEHNYVITKDIFDSLEYGDFSSIINIKNVLKYSNNSNVDLENKKKGDIYIKEIKKLEKKIKVFYYNFARGCLSNCSFCGGSNMSQRIINKRCNVIFKSPESVINDIKMALSYGVERIHFNYYPFNDKYYANILRLIRKNNLNFYITLECFNLPSIDLLKELKATFNGKYQNDSKIILSPENFNETIRELNKSFFYSNKDILKFLFFLNNTDFNIGLCLISGLPFERRKDFKENLIYTNFLLKKIKKLEIQISTVPIEPFSPMFINPGKYKIKKTKNSFLDYMVKNCDELGYISNFLKSDQIKRNINRFSVFEKVCR